MLLKALLAFARLAVKLRRSAAKKGVSPPFRGDRPLRAAFFSAYPAGHYGTVSRLSSWVDPLAKEGIEVEVCCPATAGEFAGFGQGDPEADRAYLAAALANRARQIESARDFDVVFLHRGLFPYGPWQRPTFERILSRFNSRVIYDFYDSIWVYRRQGHAGARGRLGRWLNPPDLVESIEQTAQVVTVSNGYLADFAGKVHADVRILPMVLDPASYTPRRSGGGGTVVLGWMGSGYNLKNLAAIGPALRAAAKEVSFTLRVVSSEPFELDGVEVTSLTHPFSPESEREDLAAMDVGLLPLGDTVIDRGKSPLKLVQYGAASLPIMASPSAVDARHFPDGEAILFAGSPEEWTKAIVGIVRDANQRASLGNAARRAVEDHYSFAAHAKPFADLLREVASMPTGGTS